VRFCVRREVIRRFSVYAGVSFDAVYEDGGVFGEDSEIVLLCGG
jgi:hypothetical protein